MLSKRRIDMKAVSGHFQGKSIWILLVLAVISQTMVFCGVRDDGSSLQVQAMEREKATETESIPEEEYGREVDAGIEIEFPSARFNSPPFRRSSFSGISLQYKK